MTKPSITSLNREIVACMKCNRLVNWRNETAANPPARFRDDEYWAKPLPGFGDQSASVLIVGLAPAAHGGNRTGRIFTGDRSGDWLFRALHKAKFANQANSDHVLDGLKLSDCYISAVVRCAPPANKPRPEERDNCIPYLEQELKLLTNLKVVVALGSFAWDGALRALRGVGAPVSSPKPKFGHESVAVLGEYVLIGSFHPSQQNTFTGKLTEEAFDRVFQRVRSEIRKSRR